MGVRGGLTDGQWALIAPLLPDRAPRRGGQWTDHRAVIDAVALKYRNNLAWRNLPGECPPWQTVLHRFTRWARGGTWHRILTALQARADADGDLDWLVGVDSTIVRTHPARRRRPEKAAPRGEPADHALGRSRGGLTTNVHLAADGRCRPLAFVVTAGQANDAPHFTAVTASIRVPRAVRRPRVRPDHVLADRTYSSRAIRAHLRTRGIRPVIPEPADQQENRRRRGRRGRRPRHLDRDAYRLRNTVERCINQLTQWRGIAMRTDKLATNYQAALHASAIFL